MVQMPRGLPTKVEISPCTPGEALFKLLEVKTGIPIKHQALIHRGETVKSEISLENQGIVHGSFVSISLKEESTDDDPNDLQSIKGS